MLPISFFRSHINEMKVLGYQVGLATWYRQLKTVTPSAKVVAL